MKKPHCLLLTAGALALLPLPAQAKITRSIEKDFVVLPGGRLRVDSEGGNISVTPSTDGVVRVVARETVRADTDQAADEILSKLRLSIEQKGRDVTAYARYEEPSVGFHFGSWPPVEVDFVVTVPASFAAELTTSGGNVSVGDLAGSVRAHTSGGDIGLGKLGGEVTASTSGGNVSLEEGDGAVNLRTSGGQIKVGRSSGPTDLNTSGGNVDIGEVEGPLRASTSGGDMRAGFEGPLRGDCELKTSGGTVTVTVDRTAGFDLDASTSGGSVNADGLTITIERGGFGKSHLTGNVNGGGPRLMLHSSGGDIDLKLR
jgi:DUF4097 and DUF4098 domain-containing protein YvlB